MAGLARAGVDEAGVEPVRLAQRQRQALAVLRRQDEMNVVRHLAIRPDLDAEAAAGFPEPVAIESIVALLEDNVLPPGATLTSRDAAGRERRRGRCGSWATVNMGAI